MTNQQNNHSELLQDLDRYRQQNNYLSTENQTLRGLLLSFMIETRFDPDEVCGGYFKVKEIINEAVKKASDEAEQEHQERKDVADLEPSNMILKIGRRLLSLYNEYHNIARISINKDSVSVYLYNKDKFSELCFTILSIEGDDDYACDTFLDSDWATSASNFKDYDSILYDVSAIIFEADNSYQKHNVSIGDIVDFSDTGQNPLYKGGV